MRENLILENIELKDVNWWKVGGRAQYFSAPKTIDELKYVLKSAHDKNWKYWVISGGSNVLIKDGLVQGLVISMHSLSGIEKIHTPKTDLTISGGEVLAESLKGHPDTDLSDLKKDVLIECLAGTPKSEVAKIFIQNRLLPAVFLTGIPGDMGAGVVMNAGIGEARVPREFCEIVREIEVLRWDDQKKDLVFLRIPGSKIQWEYRHSSGWQPGIITRVVVAWPFQPDVNVPKEVKEQTRKRVSTQPLDLPNCGSVFRNPVGHKSAQLIEGCGLKGFRVGGACVSKKHANFIVNDQGATAEDVHQVIEHVRATVFKEKGVQLKTEVVYIGDWSN